MKSKKARQIGNQGWQIVYQGDNLVEMVVAYVKERKKARWVVPTVNLGR